MKLFNEPGIPVETINAVNGAALKGKLPCGVLLSGGNEKLRKKCALELAACALCPNKKPSSDLPCLNCAACRRVKAGLHPDVAVIVPEDGKKLLSVNIVRQRALSSLYASPAEGENKVYIFPNADDMQSIVQNSLLKSIEEPPADVLFIFCCEQRESLLPTVISRLTEYNLGEIFSAERENIKEKINAAAGSVALSLANGNEFSLMLAVSVMHKNRRMMGDVAKKLILIIRDAMAQVGNTTMFSGCDEAAFALSRGYNISSLLKIKEIMDTIISNAEANANENLLITRFSSLLAQVMKERINTGKEGLTPK